jgi:hypothetical protein
MCCATPPRRRSRPEGRGCVPCGPTLLFGTAAGNVRILERSQRPEVAQLGQHTQVQRFGRLCGRLTPKAAAPAPAAPARLGSAMPSSFAVADRLPREDYVSCAYRPKKRPRPEARQS